MGIIIHKKFHVVNKYLHLPAREDTADFPSTALPDYYEWISIIESVLSAKDDFTMYELGAGTATWLVNAAGVIRKHNPIPFKLVGVEADPTHFQWMKEHFINNGIEPDDHILLEKAVHENDGFVDFWIGRPDSWWGNYVNEAYYMHPPGRDIMNQGSQSERPRLKRVPAVSLKTLLRGERVVDLIHSDCQGSELCVFSSSKKELDEKVKRVHFATHGRDIENILRKLFKEMGWRMIWDFSGNTVHDAPYGRIELIDGIQEYINPRFGSCNTSR